MLVHYKKNKKPARYDSDALITAGRIPPDERPHGSFKSCGNCPYPSHGFICYSSEGDCLRTDMQKINNRRKAANGRVVAMIWTASRDWSITTKDELRLRVNGWEECSLDKQLKNRLPEQCLFMNANGEIMRIEYGKPGFSRSELNTENGKANRVIVNSYNERHGITAEQINTWIKGRCLAGMFPSFPDKSIPE